MNIEFSENIMLIELKEEDSETFLSLINTNRESLRKYLYWVDSIEDNETTKEYLKVRINSPLPGAQWFKIFFNQSICGMFGIKSIEDDTAEIGYWLSSSEQGKGVISKIVKGVSKYLQESHGVKHIEFRCL